ncbi:MAG: TRAP transporter substrate-binding protein [Deltaproteobacteria bacterium]|nr:TRAP transporter substrate-binding protein [Deltaproteobacteria bacterium]
MFRSNRVVFYFAFILCIPIGVTLFSSGEVLPQELKIAHFMSPKHPMDVHMMRPWAAEVEKLSKGSLKVRIYPGGELGKGPREQFKRAVDGIADITFGLQGYTSKLFPRTTLIELPAVAVDAIDATKKLWNVLDKHLSVEYQRVKLLALWTNDGPVLMSKEKPIRKIDDLKGLKVRVPSKDQADLIANLGATPVSMPASEMYRSLSTGVVDVLLVPSTVITSFKIGEVAKFYSTGLTFGRSPFFLAMNRNSYKGLSPEHKSIVDNTTGISISLVGAKAYEAEGAEELDRVRKSEKHEVIDLPAEEVKRGNALLIKARDQIVARLEKEGVSAKAILAAMGAAN